MRTIKSLYLTTRDWGKTRRKGEKGERELGDREREGESETEYRIV